MDLLAAANRMAEAGHAFVLATVVWRRGPSSGQQGAKAIVTADGALRGWIGGACAEPSIVQIALECIRDGAPRLVYLGPADELDGHQRHGVTTVPMACESEGAMEVYLEPVIPVPKVVVVGESPAAVALTTMCQAIGWQPVASAGPALGVSELEPRDAVVVASQGHYDEDALLAALETRAGYIGLIASTKRAATVMEYLRHAGASDESLLRIHAPAGLDLGPTTSIEISVSILAELVALRTTGSWQDATVIDAPPSSLDPVCGMTVDPATAHFSTEHEGSVVYFCAAGCKRAFESNPDDYTISEENT